MTRSAPQIPATVPAAAGAIARLAWPTMLSRSGILIMGFVDIVMVGRYATDELAYAALGYSLFIPALVTAIGLQFGAMPAVARAYGTGNYRQCGIELRRGLPWALITGTVAGGVVALSEIWLLWIGHDPQLAAEAGAVAIAVSFGVPVQIVYVVCSIYLEATRRPIPGMIFMFVANILNVGLNWVLIYGHLGFPELGAVGSAIGTSVIRVFMLLLMLAYIYSRANARAYGLLERAGAFWGEGGWKGGREMRRIGFAAAFSHLVETGAFSVVLQFAGFMGTAAVAAYSIAHNLTATIFMLSLGIASATAVLVGNAHGQEDRRGVTLCGWTGIIGSILVMAVCGIGIVLGQSPLAGLYTDDPVLYARTLPLLLLVAVVGLADGSQVVASQAVRGLGDSWTATRMHVVAWIFICIPAAWILGFTADLEERGLIIAGGIGALASLALMCYRFSALVRLLLGYAPARSLSGHA